MALILGGYEDSIDRQGKMAKISLVEFITGLIYTSFWKVRDVARTQTPQLTTKRQGLTDD